MCVKFNLIQMNSCYYVLKREEAATESSAMRGLLSEEPFSGRIAPGQAPAQLGYVDHVKMRLYFPG